MNTNKFFSLENYKSGTYDDCGDFKAFNPSFINQNWNWADADLNYLLAEANKELGALNTYSELIENIDVYILIFLCIFKLRLTNQVGLKEPEHPLKKI